MLTKISSLLYVLADDILARMSNPRMIMLRRGPSSPGHNRNMGRDDYRLQKTDPIGDKGPKLRSLQYHVPWLTKMGLPPEMYESGYAQMGNGDKFVYVKTNGPLKPQSVRLLKRYPKTRYMDAPEGLVMFEYGKSVPSPKTPVTPKRETSPGPSYDPFVMTT